jgi:hypothetical protein
LISASRQLSPFLIDCPLVRFLKMIQIDGCRMALTGMVI